KESYLKRRIAARMRAVGVASYAAYAACLDSMQEEYALLKDRITVNVTEFFRDADVYEYLAAEVLPRILERKAEEGGGGTPFVRIWSAGCSSGEEPYSLAALLLKLNPEM